MLNISLPSDCKYSTDHIFYVTKKNDWRADWRKYSLIYFTWGSPGICCDLCPRTDCLNSSLWAKKADHWKALKSQQECDLLGKHNSDILCLGAQDSPPLPS